MSSNFFEDIIYNIKRTRIHRKLERWKTENTGLMPSAYKKIKPENQEKAKSVYVRRSIDGTDIFVDIYWYIKRSKRYTHEDFIYYRCNWTVAQKIINRVENNELPERVNSFVEEFL